MAPAPREDLIASAVSFLQDPTVSSSPPDTKVAFLRSKNLTREEIGIALARVGVPDAVATGSQGSQDGVGATPRRPPPPQMNGNGGYGYGYGSPYGYGPYPGGNNGGPWMQPEPPRRDWRDWFIMATVTSGIGWGLYTAAQRYIVPIIRPPTPPQLDADKASVDESFSRAFALIEQLASDTTELKNAEKERSERLDTALRDIENVVSELKAANTRRESEARIVASQVDGLRDMVPKSLEEWKKGGDKRLEEIAAEVGGLRRLVENRVGSGGSSSSATGIGANSGKGMVNGVQSPPLAGYSAPETNHSTSSPAGSASTSASATNRKAGGGRASIPAWQMAAAAGKNGGDKEEKRTKEESTSVAGEGASATS